MTMTLVFGQKNDLQKHQLKGKVETIISNQYELVLKFGELTKGNSQPHSSYAYSFDQKGNIVVRSKYNSKEGKFEYEYVAYKYATDGTIEYDNEYIKKQEKRKSFFSSLASDLTGEDIGGKVQEKEEIVRKSKYTYKENKVVIDRHNVNDKLIGKIVREYTDDDRLLSEIIYDSYGDLIYKGVCTYKDGLLVKEEKFEHSEVYKRGKGTETVIFYVYDENGNVIKEEGYEIVFGVKIDFIKEYTYTFDEQENWIERTQNIYLSSVLGKEEKSTIMERKITYYQN